MRTLSIWIPTLAATTLAAAAHEEPVAEGPTVAEVPTVELPATLPFPAQSLWWADFDGDGLDDAYVVQPDGSGRLLHGLGDAQFSDVTDRVLPAGTAGAHMAVWGDVDGDARLDLYLPAWRGESRLLLQSAEGAFVDASEASGLPLHADPVEANFRDIDADGDLDLHLLTEVDDLVLKNDGRGRFERLDLGIAPRLAVDPRRAAETVDEARAMRGLPPIDGGAAYGPGGPGIGFEIACAIGVQDQANPSDCLNASTVPTLGMLYPISTELYVDAGTGNVGIGTTSPTQALEVIGTFRASGDVRGSRGVFSASPPLAVSSTILVTNLNSDFLDGLDSSAFATLPVTGGDIADGSITGADVADGTLSGSDIADDTITGADLGPNSVGSSEISNNAVGSSEIIDDSITGADIGPNSVGSSEISNNAVGSSEIIDDSITGADIGPNSVGSSEISNNAVGSSEIIDDSITGADIGTNSVGASEISANAVGSSEIASNAVGSSEIAASAVGSSEIADGSIVNADVSAAAAIAGTKIAPDFGAQTVVTDGSAGVGTSGPNAQLHVNGATGIDPLRVQVTGGTRLFVEQSTGDIAVGGFFNPATPLHVDGHTFGQNTDAGGRGIEGFASNSGATAQYGTMGFNAGTSSSGAAVYGGATATTGSTRAVWGSSSGSSGIAVYGTAAGGSSTNSGVWGRTSSTNGRGVRGEADATTGTNFGVQGRTHSPSGWGVISFGSSGSTGQKNFIQPHPTDATKEIRFISLEGNESGTYFRGKSRTLEGVAIIDVPEEFRLVSTLEDLTVQTTAIGGPAQIWVESYDLDMIVVRSTADVEFHYMVNSVRRGFTQPTIVTDNTSYVPEVAGVEAFTELPDELRRILVDNGILNPDFTPNQATAAAMGWKLMTPEEDAEMKAPGPQPTPVSPLLKED